MNGVWRAAAVMLALTAVSAAAGGWVGVRYGNQSAGADGLDELLHHELNLSTDQQRQIEAMEQRFAEQRRQLEGQMRVADGALATAIVNEHRYGPQARQAIETFHAAMATLQEDTVQHVLAMRTVLTTEQAQQFDQTVAKALNSDRQ